MKIEIAIRNGEYVSINEVESGLKCNCRCIDCKKVLIAKKGKKNRHHFSHFNHLDKECSYCPETIIHKIAKDVIYRLKKFRLPKVCDDKEGELISIDECKIEPLIQERFRPDLIIKSGDDEYYIEILVSHKCTHKKEDIFKKYQLNTIEINLSGVFNNGNIIENIKKIVLEENERKYWLYNSKKVEPYAFKDNGLKIYSTLSKNNTDSFLPSQIPLNNIKGVVGPKYCPCKYVSKWEEPLELEFDCKNCNSFKGLSNDGKFVLCTRINKR